MILYIAKRGPHDIGAKTHLQAVKDLYGESNVIEVDLLKAEIIKKDNFMSFGNNLKNYSERIKRYVEGNSVFISNQIINELLSVIKSRAVNLVFTEESDLGNLYLKIRKEFPNVEIICFFHDISACLFKMRIEHAPKWRLHYILECKRIIQQEKVTVKNVSRKWIYNEQDSKRLFECYGVYPDAIVPLASWLPQTGGEYKSQVCGKKDIKKILFVCSSYYVNIDGFMWFYNNVMPRLDSNYTITVVGDGSEQLGSKIDASSVRILGKVDSMAPYYEDADIVIAPVFDGGGMKVKTIEALSFGKCFISTSESLNGYWEKMTPDVCGRMVFRCNTAEEWAKACNTLLNSEVKKYNEEIFAIFKEHFSYDTLRDSFEKLIPILE